MKFTQVDNSRAYQAIVDQVCEAILRGALQSGDYLPSERDVALQSGLSRSSVRQAFQEMKEAGLVGMFVGAGGGTQIVSDFVPRELLSKAAQMSQKQLLELSEARMIVELAAVELATARATEAQIHNLWEIYRQMEAVVEANPEDRMTYERIDLNFHQQILKASNNEILFDMYTSLLPHVITVIDMVDIHEMQVYGIPTTKKVIEAIENRNPLEAKASMAAHISPVTEFIKRFFKSE